VGIHLGIFNGTVPRRSYLISQNAQTCAVLVLTDLSTLHSAVIPQSDVTRSHNLNKNALWP